MAEERRAAPSPAHWEFRAVYVGPSRRARWIWVKRTAAGERASAWFLTYEACLRDAVARGYTGNGAVPGRAASAQAFENGPLGSVDGAPRRRQPTGTPPRRTGRRADASSRRRAVRRIGFR